MTAATQPRTAERPRPAADGGGKARANKAVTRRPFTDAEKAEARSQFERAFAMLGLVADGRIVCPRCGENRRGKVVLKRNYWKCHPCESQNKFFEDEEERRKNTSAVTMLMELGGYSYPDATNALLGRPTSRQGAASQVAPTVTIERAEDFTAVVDCDVYDAVVAAGSSEAAQRYYGRFHISPAVVAEVGCVVVADPGKLFRDLTARFGRDRLVASGLVKPGEDGKRDYMLCNRDYPVVEPHRRPDGRVVGMQFRPSLRQEEKIRAHKAYTKARDAAEAAGGTYEGAKVDYVPKFLSLRGGVPGRHIVGGGVQRIASLAPGAEIYIVEGLKDLMAARTMGVEAYAIPGVGIMPPEQVCRILSRHRAVICMDGDQGGEAGAANLEAWFNEQGVTYRHKAMPDGMDVTDVLVERYAKRGCDCRSCAEMRART